VVEVLVGAIVLGVAAGVAWALLAPEIQGQVTASGVTVRGAEARRQFSVNGWFAVVGAASGVALAIAAMLRHHRRPITALLTIVGAGVVGSAVAWRMGVVVGPGPVDDRAAGVPAGASLAVPLELSAPGVLLIWPIASVVAVAIIAAVTDDHRPSRSDASRSGRSGPISQSSA
jgi:hypothetical protein